MEKITVKTVTAKKQGVKNNKTWTLSEIITTDNRKFNTFDFMEANGSYDVTIEPASDPKYNATVKKAKADNNYVQTKQAEIVNKVLETGDKKEQRITMLSCISSACNYYQQRQGTIEQVQDMAKQLFYLAMTHQINEMPF